MSQKTNAPIPVAQPLAPPARSPFPHTVAGAGIVEARTENVSIGTPTTGIVAVVPAIVGQQVKPGDPLFSLDDRPLRAEKMRRAAAVASAKAKLARLEAMPRTEELPPLEARVVTAEAGVASAQAAVETTREMFARAESVSDPRAMTREEVDRRRLALREAEARAAEAQTRVADAKAQLALMRAGAWKPDIDTARADLAVAESDLAATEVEIDRLVVRSPMEGEVLKVDVRAGELAVAGASSRPLILLGNLNQLHVRVDVDEADIWRYTKGAKAVACVRGNSSLTSPLEFVRIEPWVVPKRSLTGDTTERVDTRVMQLIYRFDPKALPVLVGQQLDVFLEGLPTVAMKDKSASPTPASQSVR